VDGTVKSVYCHFDGSDHLETLQGFYNSQEKAEALVSLGDISVLDDLMDCPEGHSFDTPVKGYCVFYHRDRGEDWEDTEPQEFRNLKSARRQDRGQEFIYEWTENQWRGYDIGRKRYIK